MPAAPRRLGRAAASRTGWTSWSTARSAELANGDLLNFEDVEWHASLVVPIDDEPGAQFIVGAACWSRGNTGQTANYFEYPTVPFDVTEP